MYVSDVTAVCHSLGFVCRFRDGEYRLARPLLAYRSYGRRARQVQELQAYYTDDGLDCVRTARKWRDTLEGVAASSVTGVLFYAS